jgi:Phage integrase family
LRVEQTIYRGTTSSPKTQGSRRTLPLPQPILQTLLTLYERRLGKSDLDLVFATSKGTPLSDTNLLHRELKPAGRKIGTPWLGWHTLRRTHATLLQAAGRSLKDAQAQLGHTKLSTTLEPGFAQISPASGNQGSNRTIRFTSSSAAFTTNILACVGDDLFAAQSLSRWSTRPAFTRLHHCLCPHTRYVWSTKPCRK